MYNDLHNSLLDETWATLAKLADKHIIKKVACVE